MAEKEWYTTTCKESELEPTADLGPPVRGYDFSEPSVDYHKLFLSFRTTGFQASCFDKAVEEINKMVTQY
jgi:hypothetical protein